MQHNWLKTFFPGFGCGLARSVSCLVLVGLLGIASTSQARAQWVLDSAASSVSFTSVKNGVITESHQLSSMTGQVSETGAAQVDIDLNSVETLIPIRNERLRELLFQTADFPLATIVARVDLAPLLRLTAGATQRQALSLDVKLHGQVRTLSVDVQILRLNEADFMVSSIKPVVIQAADFGLAEGVEALRAIAQLGAITPSVPVGFVLVFRAASED